MLYNYIKNYDDYDGGSPSLAGSALYHFKAQDLHRDRHFDLPLMLCSCIPMPTSTHYRHVTVGEHRGSSRYIKDKEAGNLQACPTFVTQSNRVQKHSPIFGSWLIWLFQIVLKCFKETPTAPTVRRCCPSTTKHRSTPALFLQQATWRLDGWRPTFKKFFLPYLAVASSAWLESDLVCHRGTLIDVLVLVIVSVICGTMVFNFYIIVGLAIGHVVLGALMRTRILEHVYHV